MRWRAKKVRRGRLREGGGRGREGERETKGAEEQQQKISTDFFLFSLVLFYFLSLWVVIFFSSARVVVGVDSNFSIFEFTFAVGLAWRCASPRQKCMHALYAQHILFNY